MNGQTTYIQYSHDIDFDYSTGRWPLASDSKFTWEEYYIPIDHEVNRITVGKHVWRREKLGINGTWSLPQYIVGKKPEEFPNLTVSEPLIYDIETGELGLSEDLGASTFLELTDTPNNYVANKYLRVNSLATGVDQVDINLTSTFLELTDTPSTYSGQGDKYPKVNTGETGIEFVDIDLSSTFLDLTDTPSSYTNQGNKYPRVNATETGIEFVDITLDDPYNGYIYVASDFPTTAFVKRGYWYSIGANVTDNDVTKTNTLTSWLEGDTIYWDGTTWLEYTNVQIASQVEAEAVADTEILVIPSRFKLISVRRLYDFIKKFITLAHTWTLTQTFLTVPILDSLKGKSVIGTDADGYIIDNSLIEYFDATVGTGGNYPATSISDGLEQAISDGKVSIKIISNISLFSDIIIPSGINIYIDIKGFELNAGTYNITIGSAESLYIKTNYNNVSPFTNRGSMVFAYASEKRLFETVLDNLKVEDILITNNSTIASARIADSGLFTRCMANVSNYTESGFGKVGSDFMGKLDKTIVNGAGTGSTLAIHSSVEKPYTDTDIKLTGDIPSVFLYNVNGLSVNTAGVTLCSIVKGNNLRHVSGTLSLDVREYLNNAKAINAISIGGNYPKRIFNNIDITGDFTILYTSSINIINGIKVSGNAVINSADNVIKEMLVVGTTTIAKTTTTEPVNNELEGSFTGAVTLSGDADSTSLKGRCASTLTLSAGVGNCSIDIGVTTADETDGTNNSVVNNSGVTTNRIKTKKTS